MLGTVKLEGQVPKPKGYNLTTLPDQIYCGRISDGHGWRLLQPFNVGPAGEFRDVVVYLEGIEKGKSFASTFTSPRIEARDCRFVPFTTIVREKENVVVVNMDPVMHDIQAYESSQLGARVLFNVPLPMNPQHPRDLKDRSDAAMYHKHLAGRTDEAARRHVKRPPGVRHAVRIPCLHGKLGTGDGESLLCHDRYRTDSFDISDIPPGTYKMVIWHPYVGGAKEQSDHDPAEGTDHG